MKDSFFKIWKDAVWSKVIASSIIGSAIIIWSYFNVEQAKTILKDIISFKVDLLNVIILIVIFYVIHRLIKYFKLKKPTQKELYIENLKRFNSMDNSKGTLHYTWQVGFSEYTQKPFAYNITCFCKFHEFPLRFKYNCNDTKCENNKFYVSESELKNWIESALYDDWRRLNGNL